MTVYVVYYQEYDDVEIVEAYRSEEDAKRVIREDYDNGEDYYIEGVPLY